MQVSTLHMDVNVCVCVCDCDNPFSETTFRPIEQMLHVAVCAYVPLLTHSSLQQKQGLPLLNQVISWTTLGRWLELELTFETCLNPVLFWSVVAVKLSYSTFICALLKPVYIWCLCSSFSILIAGTIVEFHSSFPPSPQHPPLPHCHIPTAQYWVRQVSGRLSTLRASYKMIRCAFAF